MVNFLAKLHREDVEVLVEDLKMQPPDEVPSGRLTYPGVKSRLNQNSKTNDLGNGEPEGACAMHSSSLSTILATTTQQEHEQRLREHPGCQQGIYHKTDRNDRVTSYHQHRSPPLSPLPPSQETLNEVPQQSTTLDPQSQEHELSQKCWQRKEVIRILVLALVLIAILVTIVLLLVYPKNENSMMASFDPTKPRQQQKQRRSSTLDRIHDRGHVICRGDPDELNQGYGFSIDMCSAIAAGILHDPTKYEILRIPFQEMFLALANRSVDISTSQTTLTMQRDIREASSKQGMRFSTAYFYSGTTFFGLPEYVDCADRQDTLVDHCRDIVVCVLNRSVQADFVKRYLGGSALYPVQFSEELFARLSDGRCNVVASAPLNIYEQIATNGGEASTSTDKFVFAPRFYDRDPLALVSRNDDPVFGDLVNWLLRALIVSETMNITRDSANLFPTTDLFGDNYKKIFQNAIAAVGNYGDMYKRAWGQIPRPQQSVNTQHLNAGGLLYPNPWGMIDSESVADESDFTLIQPVPNGTLEAIQRQRELYCGIILGRSPGLAEWDATVNDWLGMDVDFCRGLAASLFGGDIGNSLIITAFATVDDGFVALHEKDIDVLSGSVYNMESDVKHPVTLTGFEFGDIYYYYEDIGEGEEMNVVALAMATRQGDEGDGQFTDFVRAMIASTIHAEDIGITQSTAREMPVLELFGQTFRQSFRFMIEEIGSYKEVYERNMEKYLPRIDNPRNTLNSGDSPLFYTNWEF